MTKVELRNLVENDYNPRRRFDDASMKDLKESIKKVGLAQSPTVRPSENGKYEVVAGSRRLRALRDLYNGNKEIDVNIKKLSDDEARTLSIIENVAREDLTPVEEGIAYADYITTEVEAEDGEIEEMTVLEAIRDTTLSRIPSDDSGQVGSLADEIGCSSQTIHRRMRLVTLPEKVQKAVEDGELKIKVAEQISRLYQIPDVEYREQKMEDLATNPAYRGEEPALSQLNQVVSDLIKDYEEEKEEAEKKLEEFEEVLDEKKLELEHEFGNIEDWLEEEEEIEVEDKIDEGKVEKADYPLESKASQVVDWMQERISSFGGKKFDDLQDKLSKLETSKGRLERNLKIVKEENPERCPFCGAGVKASHIEERISGIDDEMEGVQQKMSEINERQSMYQKKRKKLRKKLSSFREKRKNYESKGEELK